MKKERRANLSESECRRKWKLSIVVVLLAVLIASFLALLVTQKKAEDMGLELPAPPPDAVIINSCGLLNESGRYYLLDQQIIGVGGTCFSITAQDITFDGNGYLLSGTLLGNGVESIAINSRVINLEISNFDYGLFFGSGSLNSSVVNINSHDNSQQNIYNLYEITAQIKTMKDIYYSGEVVKITDASEIP